MTAPRQVLPGTVYLLTRRCSEQRFFLRPSPATNAIFLYVLAVAAQRFRIAVHALCVMSNHYHLVITDVDARLPAFMQYLDSLVARATNTLLGRWEGFWSSETSYSAVAHGAIEDIARKVAYVLDNPVAAGLVRSGREWPGLWTGPDTLGSSTLVARRPDVFFSSTGEMPASATLTLATPHGFSSAEEFQEFVKAALNELEGDRGGVATSGRAFLGRARVLAQDPFARPASATPHRELKPRVAGRDKWKRIEALSRLKQFLSAYRSAWALLKSGVADVVFPAGTYHLRIEHNVRCEAPA